MRTHSTAQRSVVGLLIAVAIVTISACLSGHKDQSNRRLLGANYYPWYDEAKWSEGHTNTPLLGRYRSDDPEVIEQHLRWAQQAGIDFLSVEWTGQPGSFSDTVFRRMLQIDAASDMQFALFYDSAINLTPNFSYQDRVDFDAVFQGQTSKGDKFLEDMTYIGREYFHSQNYLRINGCPAVFFYPVGGWSNSGEYLDQLKAQLTESGTCIYAIAEVMGWLPEDVADHPWDFWKEHFQAITGGIMHCQPCIEDPQRGPFLTERNDRIRRYAQVAEREGLGFIPPVIVGFDDGRPGITPIPRNDGQTLRRSWNLATDTLDDLRIVTVMTFNEWHEGTEVEPSREHGDTYIDLLRALRDDR